MIICEERFGRQCRRANEEQTHAREEVGQLHQLADLLRRGGWRRFHKESHNASKQASNPDVNSTGFASGSAPSSIQSESAADGAKRTSFALARIGL